MQSEQCASHMQSRASHERTMKQDGDGNAYLILTASHIVENEPSTTFRITLYLPSWNSIPRGTMILARSILFSLLIDGFCIFEPPEPGIRGWLGWRRRRREAAMANAAKILCEESAFVGSNQERWDCATDVYTSSAGARCYSIIS